MLTSRIPSLSLGRGLILALPALVSFMGPDTSSGSEPAIGGTLVFSNEQWPSIHVTGAAGVYTHTTSVGHGWQVHMHYDPGGDKKVVDWQVWPSVSNTQDLVAGKPVGPDLKSWQVTKSEPGNPYSVNETVGNIISTELQPWAVKQCNDLVNFLGDNGMDATEIHAVDRPLAVEWRAKSLIKAYDPTPLASGFGQSDAWSDPMPSVIICQAISAPTDPVGADGIALNPPDFELIDTHLNVFYTASGQCPKDIMVSSMTRSNVPGQFKLWYEIQSANAGSLKSGTYTLGTGAPGAGGLLETPHLDTFQVPLTGLQNTGTGGQTTGAAADTAGFLPGVGAGGGTSGPVTAGADFNNAVATPANEHVGKIRVVAQQLASSPENTSGGLSLAAETTAQTVASAWDDFHIVCDTVIQPALGDLPGNIQSEPKPAPTVRLPLPGAIIADQVPMPRQAIVATQQRRLQEKQRRLDRQQAALDLAAKRKLETAARAEALQAEAEARRLALVVERKAAERKRLAKLAAQQKKAEQEARRRALIAEQKAASQKRLAAAEVEKKLSAAQNRPRKLGVKKSSGQLRARLKNHSN